MLDSAKRPGDGIELTAAGESWLERPPNIVVRNYGQFFDVETPAGLLRCTLRGVLKRERRKTDVVAVGDRVEVQPTAPGEGVIVAVAPRTRALSRLARGTSDVEQVILANPDQLLVVFAAVHPEPHPRMLDRFLLIGESSGIPSTIVVNKIDLDPENRRAATFAPYRAAGYQIIETSAVTGAGLAELEAQLHGRISVLAGPSGVGKSSLINLIAPGFKQRVGEISDATGKGRHTTTASILIPLDAASGTYIADTPGIRQLSIWGLDLARLDQLFPEFRPFREECYYADCSHLNEPGCAVREAVEVGAIDRSRYESYRALRDPLGTEE